jgi:REP element-mobilizing transposase RayT
MSHTYSRIWNHYVWSPKDRAAILNSKLIAALIKHYKTRYPKGGDIYVDTVNGVDDHIHLLIGQKPVVSPSKVANQVKGESSHWINSNDFLEEKFAWQDGFGVFSVSHSQVERVREYIKNQQEHHKKITFEEEYRKFLKVNDIVIDEDTGKVKGRKRPEA